MSISALKPGPVVPPGTQKVPDQAARISQSVSFGHLSDILGFLGGGHFLTLFLINFHDFHFITFYTFSLFWFCHFWWFSILSIFVTFWIFMILVFFTVFYYFDLFLSFEKGILKIRPSFDLFCPPSSTPMASTLGGSIPYVKNELFFFLSFLKKCVFLIILSDFWSFFLICH